jgi:hypothetical protein
MITLPSSRPLCPARSNHKYLYLSARQTTELQLAWLLVPARSFFISDLFNPARKPAAGRWVIARACAGPASVLCSRIQAGMPCDALLADSSSTPPGKI